MAIASLQNATTSMCVDYHRTASGLASTVTTLLQRSTLLVLIHKEGNRLRMHGLVVSPKGASTRARDFETLPQSWYGKLHAAGRHEHAVIRLRGYTESVVERTRVFW